MSLEVNADWWKTLFDDVYLITDARSVGDDMLTCREVDLFSQMIPMKPSEKILDLCGGHGRHALEFCRRGFVHCTVFDYSHSLLKVGMQSASRDNLCVDFLQGDARNTPCADGSFHHVLILGNSLGYVGEDGADQRILEEALRLLASDGWLLVDITDGHAVRRHFAPTAWHEIGADIVVCRRRELHREMIYAREMVLDKRKGLVRDRNYGMRLYSDRELMALLARAGFVRVRRHNDFTPYRGDGDLGFMNHRMVLTAQKP